jgi:hypothetical protein
MIRRLLIMATALFVSLPLASGCRGERVVVDLIETFPSALKQPAPEVFEIVQATIKGNTRPAILVKAPSRLTWKVEVPGDGWLKTSVALREDAWTVQGDGVMFEIRITYNKGGELTNEQLMNVLVNPYGNAADRGWHDVSVDLSQHAGTAVDLIFNTRSSYVPQGAPARDDQAGDLALWGAPRITAR